MNSGIIDIHTHFNNSDASPPEEELALVQRLTKRYGIEKIIALFNLDGATDDPSMENIKRLNSYDLEATRKVPELVIGFCYLNPSHPESFLLEEIERCVPKGGMKGIKLWISVLATDKRLDPIMKRAEELNVPVLHHAWYKMTTQGRFESTPAQIADLARRFPKVDIVMAHLTGGGARGVLDIVDSPNVLVDTSGGQPESEWVEYAVKRLGAERVIYGSDWPIRDFGVQVGRVKAARLSDAERDLIFRGNALRILSMQGAAS